MKNKAIFILLILNIISFSYLFCSYLSPELEVTFFNVGQGDSIFIETPQGHQIIIDGGPSKTTLIEKISENIPFWDKTIDLIILTHTDRDHITGLFEVLDNYIVENILWSGMGENKIWEEMIKKENAKIYYSSNVKKINMGEVSFDIIAFSEEFENNNDNSVISKLKYKESTFLFPGDITFNIEKKILENDISSDILKVAHHGSKYSTSEEFLEKVNPFLAVIQVGKNSYGHPTNEVLTRLSNFDIKVLRNDIDGDIKIVSNGFVYKRIINK
ncbi:MAG: MBL fold metallo-hydrolase [Candidatus Pacebacteria bacterium]|nr:MBL fold metallo-hydrolase [Candidatus Paceibacterota bacterium]MDD4074088.1 MBL fold metallo-hydrolase [Candidatus Paceibacterota bacterium]